MNAIIKKVNIEDNLGNLLLKLFIWVTGAKRVRVRYKRNMGVKFS